VERQLLELEHAALGHHCAHYQQARASACPC
jgi:hypothetical protein